MGALKTGKGIDLSFHSAQKLSPFSRTPIGAVCDELRLRLFQLRRSIEDYSSA